MALPDDAVVSQTFILRVENARDRFAAAWSLCCQFLQHGKPVRVEIDEFRSRRSLEQNAKFHAICGELAKHRQWAGQSIDTEGWKRLLVDAWARSTSREQGRIVPSLDGQTVVALGIQTRALPVADMCELIEFAQAWCIDNDVELSQ